MAPGFEDLWRPPARTRHVRPREILSGAPADAGVSTRARLARIANRAPEVMVKVSGRTRDPGHLRAHLDYISRNGQIDLEGPDGASVFGRQEVAELARDWSTEAMADIRRRSNSPMSLSVVLSMPAGTNEVALRDAARAFASEIFGDRHNYVFALHTDTPRPHVHLSIAARGRDGERLNPKKGDLEAWRQTFAQALRDRGVEAEATPRRARGVTLKPERTPLRKIRDRHEAGQGELAKVRQSAYREAAKAAFGEPSRPPWETRMVERQGRVRGLYLAQARVLGKSADSADRALGAKVEAFVKSMPQPDSQRLALARELREANARLRPDQSVDRTRDR
jgi:hypothetical protein